MADRNTELKIAYALSRKNSIQDQVNKQQQDIAGIQDKIDENQAKMLKIDKDVNKLRVIAQRQDELKAKQAGDVDKTTTTGQHAGLASTSPALEDAPAGGDAAISTGSLDSASTATGAGSAKPGWKFYNKMTTTDKDKIKKVRDYVSRFTESCDEVETIEEDE
jgi:hypothetical protein